MKLENIGKGSALISEVIELQNTHLDVRCGHSVCVLVTEVPMTNMGKSVKIDYELGTKILKVMEEHFQAKIDKLLKEIEEL